MNSKFKSVTSWSHSCLGQSFLKQPMCKQNIQNPWNPPGIIIRIKYGKWILGIEIFIIIKIVHM